MKLRPILAALLLPAACLAAKPRVAPGPGIQDKEHEMSRRLNADRAERGLPPLAYDEGLADVARAHSADMGEHRFFAHESPRTGTVKDRLVAAELFFLSARENLADAPDVQRAQDGLLKSPHHYDNIVSTDVTHLGIGIVQGGVADPSNLLITQVFSHPRRPESVVDARGRISHAVDEARRKKGLKPLAPGGPLDAVAAEEIARLAAPLPRGIRRVMESVGKRMKKAQVKGLKGLTMDGQVLAQSESFQPPSALLGDEARQYGLAVREVRDDEGQPMLAILVLVGL